MTKKAKLPADVNSRAKRIVDLATSDEPVPDPDEGKDPASVALGRRKAGKRTTPAMAAGVASYPWSLTQPAELLDEDIVREARPILTWGLPAGCPSSCVNRLEGMAPPPVPLTS